VALTAASVPTVYLNLPIGLGVTVPVITVAVKASPPLGSTPEQWSLRSRLEQTLKIDWVGFLLVLAGVTCIVLGLQWGGNTKSWSDGSVIATLVLGPVLLMVLVGWEYVLGERAMVPPAIFGGGWKHGGSVACIISYGFCTRIIMFIFTYYVSLHPATRTLSPLADT
jgi:hypothetical protein